MTRWRVASPPPTGETPAWPPLPGGRGGGVTSCEAVRMRRYSFLMSSSGLSSLQIAGLRAEDAGLYRCGAVQHCTVLYCTVLYCTVQVEVVAEFCSDPGPIRNTWAWDEVVLPSGNQYGGEERRFKDMSPSNFEMNMYKDWAL